MTDATSQKDGEDGFWILTGIVLALPFIVATAAPWFDRPAAVRNEIADRFEGKPRGFLLGAAVWLSALAWIAAPALVLPLIGPAILALPLGTLFWARRISASGPAPAPLTTAQFLAGAREQNAVGTGQKLVRASVAFAVGALVLVIGGAVFGWSWAVSVASVAGATATITTAAFAGRVGKAHRDAVNDEIAAEYQLRGQWEPVLMAVLNVNERTLARATFVENDGKGVTVYAVPSMAMTQSEIEARLDTRAPYLTCVSASHAEIVLHNADLYPEIAAARAMIADSGGLFDGGHDIPDSPSRPQAFALRLAPGTGGSAAVAEQAAAYIASRQRTLVDWKPYEGIALTALLDSETIALRDRFAAMLNVAGWDVELSLTRDNDSQIVAVDIVRYPAARVGIAADRRESTWRELLLAVPGSSNGWKITDDIQGGTVSMAFGQKRALPKRVSGRALLPDRIDHDAWARFPIGIDSAGNEVGVDLLAGPHLVISGGSGSGKSASSALILCSVLSRGFELVVIDPVKKAAGLKKLAPYSRGYFITDEAEAAAALTAVYAEVRRRVDLIDAIDGENWRDLKGELAVRPLFLFVDEYTSLVKVDPKPFTTSASDPIMVEWTERATAQGTIQSLIGRISREARSAGVHLCIAAQRASVENLGSGIRDNLGTSIQMIVPARPEDANTLRMLFSESTAAAQEEIIELNDGVTPGFALARTEGSGVTGIRIGYMPPEDLAPYAESIGVPLGVPLELAPPLAVPQLRPGRRTAPPAPKEPDAYAGFSL